MNTLSLYLQVGAALVLGRIGWQVLHQVFVNRESGPSAPSPPVSPTVSSP